MTLITGVLLVPYGTDTLSAQPIHVDRFGGGTIRLGTSFPCAAINTVAGSPLRLNSEAINHGQMFNAPQDATALSLVRAHIKSFCRTWDKASLQFLDRYFEHIADMLKVHRDAIATKLAPFVGLYTAEDWAFSAPKPLPRAQLYASLSTGSAHWNIDDFVQVDFAFWLGHRMVAVLSQPEALTPARARERVTRLEQAGIVVFHFDAETLASRPTAFFDHIIGDFGALLQSAGTVPISPFRPQSLGDQ